MPPENHYYPPARPVGPGAHLRVVAPAGPFDRERFDQGIEWLRHRYRVTFSEDIYTRTGYFAGSDERRLSELRNAIDDEDVDAILCARGGYGCTRLLPGLDLEKIRLANKSIVGFSDITALHSLWSLAGVRSIHAPMVASLAKAPEATRNDWIHSIENQNENSSWTLDIVNPSCTMPVQGRFFGGNLAVLAALLGTPYSPPLDHVILFLEDIGERPYRVDRILTSLNQAGWFSRVSGLILGSFTEGEPGPDGVSVDEVFDHHFGTADFPVLRGFPAGHIESNQPLSFGTPAMLAGHSFSLRH